MSAFSALKAARKYTRWASDNDPHVGLGSGSGTLCPAVCGRWVKPARSRACASWSFMVVPFGLMDKVNGKPQHDGVQCKEYGYIEFVHGYSIESKIAYSSSAASTPEQSAPHSSQT